MSLANNFSSSALIFSERLALSHTPLPGNLFSRSGYIVLSGPKTKRTNSLFKSTLPVAMHFRSDVLNFSAEEVIKQATLHFPRYWGRDRQG